MSSHYNWSDSYALVNGVKVYRFKTKDFKLNSYPLYFENTSKDFVVNDMKENELNWYVYDFSVGYNSVNIYDIFDIHKSLLKIMI